jgi:hypothetical protein
MLRPSVEDAHSAYLLYPETIGLIGLIAIGSILLLLEYAIVLYASGNSGEYSVTTIVDIASASAGAHRTVCILSDNLAR